MSEKRVKIPGVQIERLTVTIEGDTPLICHKFSKSKRKEMLDNQMGIPKGKRERRDPEQDYHESLYVAEDGWYGHPACAIKNACVDCAKRFVDDLYGTEAKGAFFVIAQGIERETKQDLLMVQGEPEMREDVVRLVGRGSPADLRYRAMFRNWRMTFEIKYSPKVITEECLVNLLETAGFHIGIGDWRPSSPKGNPGPYGRFHVQRSNGG